MATTVKTSLLSLLSGLRNAALTARNEIARIDKQLTELRERRAKVASAPPHIDDLVAWAARNVDRYRERYLARLAKVLSSEQLERRGNWDGIPADLHAGGFGLFRLEHNLSVPGDMLSPQTESDALLANTGYPPDLYAVIALAADAIKAGLRSAILSVNPGAERGMPLAAREAELRAIDASIAELAAEREGMLSELRAAGDAATGESA
jgi:hypothetical protein